MATATTVAFAAGAQATSGQPQPFTCSSSTIFLMQNSPTQLDTESYAAGTTSFTALGVAGGGGGWSYNAMGYDTVDNLLYATGHVSETTGELIAIDDTGTVFDIGSIATEQNGTFTSLDANFVAGAFDQAGTGDAGTYYAMNGSGDDTLYAIDVTPTLSGGKEYDLATPIPLYQLGSGGTHVSYNDDVNDLTFEGGVAYAVDTGSSDADIDEIDVTGPDAGQVTLIPQSLLPTGATYGADWTDGNGDLGFSNNTTGEVYELSVDAATTPPSFALVSSAQGPGSSNNDAASCTGLPADLSIAKTGPAEVTEGQPVTYSITVTNNGPGKSSGFSVSDPLPAGISGTITISDSLDGSALNPTGCSVGASNVVTCVEGALPAGEAYDLSITGTAPDSAEILSNTASVSGLDGETAGCGPTTSPPCSATSTVTTDVPVVVTVSGSQTYGSSSPSFTYTTQYGSVTGTATCTTLSSGVSIGPGLAAGSSPLNGADCSGLVPSGTSSGDDIEVVGGTFTVAKAPLAITASSPSMSYGGSVPAITAAYQGFVNGDKSSSLTSAPTCSTTATSSSATGSYPSTCTGAADPDYSISYVNGSVTVGAAPLTVTVSGSETYGSTSPTFTYSLSTQATVNGTLQCGDVVVGTTSTALDDPTPGAGSYSLDPTTCTGLTSPADYQIVYAAAPDGFVVNPAPLVVTASSPSMAYGGAVPAVTAGYSGFVNGDTTGSLTAAAVCSTTATATSPVGSYPTSCSGAVDTNYSFSYVDGSLGVTSAPLTVTVSGSEVYGSGSPTFSDTLSPHVSVTGSVACSAVLSGGGSSPLSVPTPGVGSYAVDVSTCSGVTAPANYHVVYAAAPDGFTVTAAPLQITASSPSMTYGGSVPVITASYSGFVNGDSTASLTAPPSCSTTATSLSPAGSYTTACSGAVDANYTISYLNGSLSLGRAIVTITASSPSMTYGGEVAAVTGTYSGFQNGDGAGSLSVFPTCSTTATPSSPVGHYPTSCSGAVASNYSFIYVSGLETIGPASLTVTASSGGVTYGSAEPAISATYAGFVNGDSANSLTTAPTCTTTATTSSPVGRYATSCSGASDPEYTIGYTAGSLVVGPAQLTVTGSSPTMTYGGSVPAIVASYNGFVNGDSPASLTLAPICATNATSSSVAGSYATVCDGAADSNYSFTYDDGTLTVGPATVVVQASSPSVTYGGSVSLVSPSYSGLLNGDTAADFISGAACSTSATSSSPTGTYDTWCSGAAAANYTFSYLGGTLAVVPASLLVTASSPSMTYGATVPAVAPSYSGFVNGDTASSLGTAPACGTTATSAAVAGAYNTWCQGAADPDYTITYATGVLTVLPAPLSVTASSPSMTYGDAVPTVAAGYAGFMNGDGAGSLTTAASCSSTATTTSPVGTYPTSCSGASSPDYTVTYLGGELTIAPDPTTTVVHWAADPVLSGAAASLEASVGLSPPGASPAVTPTGTVTFVITGKSGVALHPSCGAAGSTVSLAGGQASCRVPAGDLLASDAPYEAVATYRPSPDFLGSDASSTEHVSEATVTLTKAASDMHPQVGASDTFTLTVASASTSTAPSGTVVVTDPLPAGLKYRSASTADGMISESGTTVTWTVPQLAIGASASASITVTVETEDHVSNTASFTQAVPDGSGGTSGTSNTVTLVPDYAVVAISETVSDAHPTTGAIVVFTEIVTDKGPDLARHVTVSSPVPTGLQLMSMSESAGNASRVTSGADPSVSWHVGSLTVGESQTMQVTFEVTASSATIVDFATVTDSTFDPTGQSHSTSAAARVVGAVTVPTTHTGEGWSSWTYWLITMVVGLAGLFLLAASRRRRDQPIPVMVARVRRPSARE